MKAIVIASLLAAIWSGGAQAQEPRWMQPYPDDAPAYWERVGPLLKGLAPFDSPHVTAMALVAELVSTGDQVAYVVNVRGVFDENNLPLQAMASEMSQVRFVGHDESGVSLEVREAQGVADRCFTESISRFLFRVDARIQAVRACANGWQPWRMLRFPLKATYRVGVHSLPLSFEASNGTMRVRLAS